MIIRSTLLISFFIIAGFSNSAPPTIILKDWQPAFKENPEWLQEGVYSTDKPEKAFIATGKIAIEGLSLKTERDLQITKSRAELAAKAELLKFAYKRDKKEIKLPDHLNKFASESLVFSTYAKTLTVQGMQTAAIWGDEKFVWASVIVTQENVKLAKNFAEQFKIVGSSYYLDLYDKSKIPADLYKAFELNSDNKLVRTNLTSYFSAMGFNVASYLTHAPDLALPNRNDPLGQFLSKIKSQSFEEAQVEFQAEMPKIDKSLNGYLRALDTKYTDPDLLNQIGACFRELGYPRLASLFFSHTLAQSEGQIHPFALTNMGLSLVSMGDQEKALKYFKLAVEKYPAEPWTEKSRLALKMIDSK